MKLLIRLIISALAIFAASYLLSGVHINNFTTAILLAIVLALLNTFLKPILVVLTIPVTIFTLGLFLLVINAIIVLVADELIGGFRIDSFLDALLFSILITIIGWVLEGIAGTKKKD